MGERSLEVDLDELRAAYECTSEMNSHYLDLKTGEILLVVHQEGVAEQNEKNKEKVEGDDEGRYVKIPSTDSREGYKDMQDFILTVDDEDLKERLCIAIDGRGAFRMFKEVLARYPEERERWFEFKEERMRERVVNWLKWEGIEFEDGSL